MPKRKRESASAARPDDGTWRIVAQKLELEGKLVHGNKKLIQALKVAKGFERQKLGKRIVKAKEEAGKEDPDAQQISRLERELDVVKTINLPALAATHIQKQISRSRDILVASPLAISLAEDIAAKIVKGPVAECQPDLAKNNVTARLLNVKQVKLETNATVEAIRKVLHIHPAPILKPPSSASLPHQTHKDASSGENPLSEVDEETSSMAKDGPESAPGTKPTKKPMPPSSVVMSDSETPESSSNDHGIEESRGDDDIVGEIGPASLPKKEELSGPGYDVNRDRSLSPSLSASSRSSDPPKGRKPSQNASTNGVSTFLPSLMMGGYWSGSESAESEVEENQPRKNRMGQRARRQLWEKKFGPRANHIKKDDRNRGWDSKKGATTSNDQRQRRRERREQDASRAANGTGSNSIKVDARPNAADTKSKGPLHPSWEAAKQAKTQEKTAKFQGTKIVFD